MATWQHLRSSTANKRPTTSLADGRIAINTNTASPGLFFKDSAGTGIVKVGPVHVGTTAPNSVPASGGSTGNYLGEQWLDTSVSPAQMKVWNGSTWVGVVADELPVSKLQDGAARQLIQTDAAGTGVEWTSNVDVPGTLDVTSTATFDSIAQHPLGSAAAPTLTFTGDTNTGIYSPGADQVAISTSGAQRLVVDASGNVGVGTASPRYNLSLGSTAITSTASPDTIDLGGTYSDTAGANLKLRLYWDGTTPQGFGISASQMDYVAASNAAHVFYRGASEVARFDNAGSLIYGTSTSPGADILSGTGFYYQIATGLFYVRSNESPVAAFNRGGNDGTLVEFKQDQTTEGTISVSGTTVSYNGAHLSRWSQLPSGAERTEILRGSVLSNIDEMCEWGNEDNEQLNRMKVSNVEGDKNVSGVFQAWDDDDDTYTNDFYCAMTGDFIIRIGAGVTVERGDLLMSAGDGTAKPQDDDIIRSKTIAKVTSTNVSCTYDDGSYCVPCVLMAC
jgi:hypothetical protein